MSKYIIKIGKQCVACGVCTKVCPREAIKIEKGIRAIVNEDKCIGCGLCLNNCPAGIINKVER